MKWIRIIILIAAFLFGLINFLLSGLQIYNTLVEKAGLWGSMHIYYSLDTSEFILFHLGIVMVSVVLLIWPIAALRSQNHKSSRTKATVLCLICILSLLLQHFLLESFLVGKP